MYRCVCVCVCVRVCVERFLILYFVNIYLSLKYILLLFWNVEHITVSMLYQNWYIC